MAGKGIFELSSASPDSNLVGNYSIGQRGNYSVPSLDRSGSSREGNEGRMYGSGKGASRGNRTSSGDLPLLSQCLMLDPFTVGHQKYSKSGELRRALDLFIRSNSDDNTFGAAHLKTSPPATVEELKRYRASVADTYVKASGRAKKLDEHLHKLNKFCESVTSTKQLYNERSNERPGALNLKMVSQIHRSPSEFVSPKLEERRKNVVLNKRVRTSVGETRAELRNNGLPRQPLGCKERDVLQDNDADPDISEERIHRLPVGGESWDKRMKRKRSVGAVCSRPSDGDAELKKPMLQKPMSGHALQSCEAQVYKLGTSSGAGVMNKSDGAPSPAGSNARATLKNEQEKSVICRDVVGLNKERLLTKASIKLTVREETHNICHSPVTKGKASRAPRGGSATSTNIVSIIPGVSTTLESWELPSSTNKNPTEGGVNNRKRSLPTGSSSPPITKWVGQRPQKISRTRRANLVSPVTNHDEGQISSEGCSPSDFSARLITSGANGSLLSKNAANGIQYNKVKPEIVSSPARFSESEESGAGDSRSKEKSIGTSETEDKATNNYPNVCPPAILLKKNRFLSKEDNPDGVRRQGRSGRVTSVSRASISPTREKLDNGTINMPLRSIRPASDKNGSKLGRPLKKLSGRKVFSRLGPAGGGSPDCTGESENDREELILAANMAYKSNFLACSSVFWKKVEALFASPGSEKVSYLAEQIRLAEEFNDSFSQMLGQSDDMKGDAMLEEICSSDFLLGEKNGHMQIGKDLASKVELVDQSQSSILLDRIDSGQIFDKSIPLYQRVLSALITEDEEYEENGAGSCVSYQNSLWNSPEEVHYVDSEIKFRDKLEFVCESNFGLQVPKNGTTNRFLSCNGHGSYSRDPNFPDSCCNGELLQGDGGNVHPNVEPLIGLSESLQRHNGCGSSYDCQYEQKPFEDKLLLELQSVGLFSETVPELHDKEDEGISQEISLLQRELYQQTGKKKMCLVKVHKVTQEGWDTSLEHIAMNRLVELAYKKLLATKGNLAIKNGIPKVSKQVALAFARRILARCRRFEESGASCFSEPALHDILSAVPPRVHEEDPLTNASMTIANGSFAANGDKGSLDGFGPLSHQSDQAFAKSGPISNRGKKKEVLLDDVVGGAVFRTSVGCNLSGGAKGKRSERDRDKDASVKNGGAKSGRSVGNYKGVRKTKTKHKQRTAQLFTSENGYVNKISETTHPVYASPSGSSELINYNGNRKREVDLASSGNVPADSLKDKKKSSEVANLSLSAIDPIDELGVESDLGAPQDLNSWFNFDVDGFQEDHEAVGLDIPMDDLSELNMF